VDRRPLPQESSAGSIAPADSPRFLIWRTTQIAIIGTFLIALCALLYFASTILVPTTAAVIVGAVLGPLEKRLFDRGVPEWLFAIAVVLILFIGLQLSAVLLSTSIIGWVQHAGDFSNILESKLHVFEGGLSAIRQLQKALGANPSSLSINVAPMLQVAAAFLTPTLAELVVFFATLFFYLLGREELRRHLVMLFGPRESRLRALKIISNIESNLARFFATVTLINAVVGTLTCIGAWIIGLPSPAVLGLLAFFCNYIPYIGPAFVIAALFAIGLVALPTFGASLWAPLLYLGMTTLEGNLITPKIVGTRLTLNPFAIVLGLTFWAWLWGPIGAFLSVPFLIIALAIRDHVMPDNDPKLPE
jgi:predicted PurR-regulated permease PerM